MPISNPTTAHNAQIVGDSLTTLTLNYQWREWVAIAVYSELTRQLTSAIQAEQDQLTAWINDLMTDLYNGEIMDGIALGMILPYAGSLASIPAKYLLCNGALRASSEYPELAAMLADNFIEGSNFRVPNLQNRFIRGATSDSDIGVSSGALSVTLTEANLPSHHHVVPAHSHNVAKSSGTASQTARAVIGNNSATADQATSIQPDTDTSDVGSGTSFQILPLNQNLYYIIKALP